MEPQEPVLKRLRALLEEGSDGEADELARLLARRARAVMDRPLRRAVLLQFLQESDDAGLLAVLQRLQEGSLHGLQGHRAVLQELALDGSLLRGLGYDRITDLYEVACSADLDAVARMFLGERHRGNPTQDEAIDDNEHLALSAGARTAAARGQDRFVLDRLLHDRDPRVIRVFLSNPRAVERDVVRIAAMRPTKPEILRLVASHARWSSRYEVRLALVCNPYTPTPIALQLMPTLLKQDIVRLLRDIPLEPQLRQAAREVLRIRREVSQRAREDVEEAVGREE